MRRKSVKWLILGICAAALAGWVALMVIIFGNKEPARPKAAPSVTPTPEEESGVVWMKTVVYYTDDDGNDKNSGVRYKYDDFGRRIRRYEFDDNAEGYVAEYEYEQNPGYTKVIERGEIESLEMWTWYDPSGVKRKQMSFSEDYEGRPVRTSYSEYDENELQTLYVWYAFGGTDELIRVVTSYDEYGHTVSQKRESYDGNYDGEPDDAVIETVQIRSVCDNQGRVIRQYVPEYPNDTGEDKWCVSLMVEYHDDGSRTETSYGFMEGNSKSDTYEGAVVKGDITEIVEYDANGNEMSRLLCGDDVRGNSSEEKTVYTRDEQGRVLTESFYIRGELITGKEFAYYLEGRQYKEVESYTTKASVTQSQSKEYVCTTTILLHGDSCYEDGIFDWYEVHVVSTFASGETQDSLVQRQYTYDENDNCFLVEKTTRINGKVKWRLGYRMEYEKVNLSEEQLRLRKEYYIPEDWSDEGTGRP